MNHHAEVMHGLACRYQLPLPFEGITVEISLTKGLIALIDAVDSDLANFRWNPATRRMYPARDIKRGGHKMKIYLHRLIGERIAGRPLQSGEQMDHINGDALDNRRANLRIVNVYQNAQNGKRRKNNTSGYKGVHFHKASGLWKVEIDANGKRYFLGYFHTPEEGYEIYKQAAKELHGEYARTE